MSRRIFCIASAMALLLSLAPAARADAMADLTAGNQALAAGDLDKALGLLTAAAQLLPQSVEAQAALGQAQLRLGKLDGAMKSYQAVLTLSPQHSQAKRVVEALKGERATFDRKLAYARTLMELQAYQTASRALAAMLSDAAEPSQRMAVCLAVAECALWANGHGQWQGQAETAMRVVNESGDAAQAAQAKVIAGLAMLGTACNSGYPRAQADQAAAILKDIGPLPAPWNVRLELVNLSFAVGMDPSKAPEVSAKLAGPLASIPPGEFRDYLLSKLTQHYLTEASERLGLSDEAAALAILWPMVCDGAVPAADATLKPVAIKGGWLPREGAGRTCRVQAADALAGVARAERARRKASLLGYWLAGAVLLDLDPAIDGVPNERLATVTGELADASRPAEGRKAGEPLSLADEIQREFIIKLASRTTEVSRRQSLIGLIEGQIARYEQAGDAETGIARFVTIQDSAGADAKAPKTVKVDLAAPLAAWASPAHEKLCSVLGQACERLGEKAFGRAAATMDPAANTAMNRFDQAAIILYSRTGHRREASSPAVATAQRTMDRYAAASRWGAVEAAQALLYAGQGEEAGWAKANLMIRRTIIEEDKLLAARKGLPAKLPAALAAALVEARNLIPPGAESAQRSRATSLAQSLVSRYEALDRVDLAESVIVAFVGPAPAGQGPVPLADWAAWTRVELLEHKAAAALGRLAEQFDGPAKLKLHDLHAQELRLLDEIIVKYPQSSHVPAAVGRVVQISNTYRDRKAWAPAEAVLAEFIKAHPKTSVTERMRYALIQVALTKAQTAFADRKDKEKEKEKAPEKLSDEYAAAIDALGAFLKDSPEGDYAPAVAGDLFAIARTYGQEGAWGVARTVLDRFAAAVPDFKDPQLLKFLQAATYLGELDRDHGLGLLRLPTRPPGRTPSGGGSGPEGGAAELGLAILDEGPAANGDESEKLSRPAGQSGSGFGRSSGFGSFGGKPAPAAVTPPAPAEEAKADGERADRPASADDLAIASIRASEQAGTRRLAMMKEPTDRAQSDTEKRKGLDVVLPGGPVLSEAEMKRQDAACDAAYAILIELVKEPKLAGKSLPIRARGEVLWVCGFFEGQSRPERAAGMIEKFLTDQPGDPDKLALSFRFLRDRLAWAGHVGPTDRIDLAWIDQRHERFEQVRDKLSAMLKEFAEHKDWVRDGRMLAVESYQLEAERAVAVSAVRSAGLLARAAQELLAISRQTPEDPAVAAIPQRLWDISSRLEALRQDEQAVHILGEIPVRFPTDPRAVQAVLRTAELYADRLNSPLRAVETYQEFLSLSGDREDVRTRIFSMGRQLAGQQRYLEALHVLGVFVDSFPADGRAPQALMAIGQTHQANSAWNDAIAAYRRISTEYPSSDVMGQVQIAIAECQVNLSDWKAARKTYEDYLQKYASAAAPNAPPSQQPSAQQAGPPMDYSETARKRIEILKNLDRYQTLLADKLVTRNKDDAQFQIARIVLEDMKNPLKAAAEFRKVVEDFPKSDQAAAAQLEIGKALLSLARTEEARKELLKVPANYPNSPLADQALHMVGLSYEQQAERLAGISVQTVKAEMFQKGQQAAYESYQRQEQQVGDRLKQRRDSLRGGGDNKALMENEEAYNAARFNGMNSSNISSNVRQAEQQAETASALQLANRQDRINEAYRQAVAVYAKAAADYPLGTKTGASLEHMAIIYEVHLKDPAAAMATYQRVVQLFPGTSVAENAALKVARFHDRQSKYDLAVSAYRDFIRTYPASSHVADAQYSLAEALEQQGRWVEAMEAYQTFRDKFSSHPAAARAAEQIQWIKAYRK